MLRSQQIADAITKPHTRMSAGALAAMAASERRATGPAFSDKSRRFLDDMLARPVSTPTATYNHPATAAEVRPPKRTRKTLSPAELAWLDRIPADPTQVPHADAAALAGLVAGISPMSSPAEARLVDSVYAPIRDFHDHNQAHADLANAKAVQVLPVPSSALPAAAEAIARETPALTESEAVSRASTMVNAAAEKQRTTRDRAINDAQDNLDQLTAKIAARSAAVRPTPAPASA